MKRNSFTIRLAAIGLICLLLWVLSAAAGSSGSARAGAAAQSAVSGSWVYTEGHWTYVQGGAALKSCWVDRDYYVDENGVMLQNEWIWVSAGGGIKHGASVSAGEFPDIQDRTLWYVGGDGRRLKNKTIWFTPFRFDGEGRCILSAEDLGDFPDAAGCGIEGLRRYVIIHEQLKEYY